ncbi:MULTISPECIES: STAS domain-containing protein [unclassified Lentimicrobium]|uniref:STAS domain-containing protein n=1 Tax=unclassified Lentimicrobium TaxID=2677434 RepID=UPI00155402B2|nr:MULTISPECIES: STAS domain-containing protein [unclassified Lentimicrobium]NPD45953.1 STAS domain-containing protein [Lentimicrobium sp. S6]NPD84280.1 STAS domain-containing protein [Lentimicrobium sp. L6]
MEENLELSNVKARIDHIEDVLSSVAAGDLDIRVESNIEDDLTGIEEAINILIDDLTYELKQSINMQNDLQEKLKKIQEQQKTIVQQQEDLMELSSPVSKVWDNILILPVIGTLDSQRTQIMMENLLQKIVDTSCTMAILDITGVPTVDTQVANHLLKTVTSARLLGADCIISGISPAIAQTIVHLGIDLSIIRTKATLQDAMIYAMKQNKKSGAVIASSMEEIEEREE